MIDTLRQSRMLLERYHNETPLGHQPHMIAHQAEESIASLTALIEQIEKAEPDSIAVALHYPDCWDTAAYPTVYDALAEVAASFRCSNDDCAHPAPQESEKWQKVTNYGQVQKGDIIRFTIGDKRFLERAKLILNAGTDKEEVIYRKKKNYYFITSMVLFDHSNHKNVEFMSAAPKEQQ